MKLRLLGLKHLLEAGTSPPGRLTGELSNPPTVCTQGHLPSYHQTCEKIVIVWISAWVTLALGPKVQSNHVRPEFGGSVVFQRNDEAAG